MMLSRKMIIKIIESEPLNTPLISELAINGIVDYFASSLLAKNQPECQQLLHWIKQEGGKAQYWLIGHRDLGTARQAALFNGFQAHLLDYDDVHPEVKGHPSAVILSALLSQISAISPANTTITGQRFLAAYVIGIDVMARLGFAIGSPHYAKGWHATATLGGIAATAAICYLHQYPFIAKALSIAATQASGLRFHFGSNVKPLHAGLAAQQAIQSVIWSQLNLSANENFLNDNIGFLAVYGQGNHHLNLSDWGMPWRIESPGLWYKNYSYCSANAYVADAMNTLLQHNKIDPAQIDIIRCTFTYRGDDALIYHLPKWQTQGRFSAEYIIACLLQNKTLDEQAFQHTLIDEKTLSLIKKVQRISLPAQSHQLKQSRFVKIEIMMKDKQCFATKIYHPRGSPQNPYSKEEMKNKLERAIGNNKVVAEFYCVLNSLNSKENIGDILANLRNILK